MDTFVEQIVAIKKTFKTYLGYVGITIAALMIMTLALLLFGRYFGVLVVFSIGYGTFKLYAMLNIEYEYIVTNSTMDIDKIIAKSSRKRIISFELDTVQRIEKYTGQLPPDITKDYFFACNVNDDNAYIVYYRPEGKPLRSFIFAPNEKMIAAMKNFLPRHLCENFK